MLPEHDEPGRSLRRLLMRPLLQNEEDNSEVVYSEIHGRDDFKDNLSTTIRSLQVIEDNKIVKQINTGLYNVSQIQNITCPPYRPRKGSPNNLNLI